MTVAWSWALEALPLTWLNNGSWHSDVDGAVMDDPQESDDADHVNLIQYSGQDCILYGSWAVAAGEDGGVAWCDDYSDPQNCIACYVDQTNIYIDKCVAGSWSSVLSGTAITYVAGAAVGLKVYLDGSDLKVQAYYNGAAVGSEQTISNASIVAVETPQIGLYSANAGNLCSEFKVTDTSGDLVLDHVFDAVDFWTTLNRDVMIWDYELSAARGIDGNGITDRVAAPGPLTCVLDNSEANSQGLLGYYALDHANLRYGFAKGMPLRLKLTYDGSDQYIWKGELEDLQAKPGQFLERSSSLSAFDFMKKVLDHNLTRIAVQENQRSDQVVQTILDNMSAAPANTSLVTDTYTTALALNSEQDERTKAMGAQQKACQSALGYAYVRGNATDGESFIFELEGTRYDASVAATLDDVMSELKLSRGSTHYANKVIAAYHPAVIDTGADTVLASLGNEFELVAGATQTISLRYRDPNTQAVRISGTDIVTPLVADTHFKMSSISGNGGNDLNDDLDISLTIGGNAVDVEVTNNAGVTGYINKLEIVGNGVYQYNPSEVIIESGDGDVPVNYDFYYQDDNNRVRDLATAVHVRVSNDITYVDQITFYADANDTLMGYAMAGDIGTRVTLTETATGLSRDFIINKVVYTIMTDGRLRLDWIPEPANTADFFQLDVDELDGAAMLSPFA